MIYLASPYSRSPEMYYQRVLTVTAKLIQKGYHVYSPIVHCHPLHRMEGMPKTFDFWQHHNFATLSVAGQLWVLTLPGWGESVGVQAEIEFGKKAQKPIFLVYEATLIRDQIFPERDSECRMKDPFFK